MCTSPTCLEKIKGKACETIKNEMSMGNQGLFDQIKSQNGDR